MPGKGIIQINYEMPFEGMLVLAGIQKYQREKIFDQIGSKIIKFPHRKIVSFHIRDFCFKESTLSRTAAKRIRIGDEWKPFDIEHLLAYFEKNPSKFKSHHIFASRRTFDVGCVPHIFIMTMDRDRPDLELVPDDHAWSPHMSIFPGQCKI